jgi:malate/lactate dehydrogenase
VGERSRAEGVIEDETRISASDVKNVIIWGNHSAIQFPDHACLDTSV